MGRYAVALWKPAGLPRDLGEAVVSMLPLLKARDVFGGKDPVDPAKIDADTDTKPDEQAKTDTETKPDTEPKPADAEPKPAAEAQPKTEADTATDADTKGESSTSSKAEEDSQPPTRTENEGGSRVEENSTTSDTKPGEVIPTSVPEAVPEPYDPSIRTDDEVLDDMDPTPRAGETNAEAQERAQAAEREADKRTEPPQPSRELGLSDRATNAISSLENIKADPVGDVNSEAGHNHYSAARQEAQGTVIMRKANGRPFDHIQDLQQGADALKNVRIALEAELRNPPDTITERGLQVLQRRYSEVQRLSSRLRGFLDSIGHGNFPPYHEWPPGS